MHEHPGGHHPAPGRRRLAVAFILLAVSGAACGESGSTDGQPRQAARTGPGDEPKPLVIGGIPDQDPEKLQRLYGRVAGYLSRRLDVPVEYRPVTDYTASVSLFGSGDLDMVWFGGLTGVQARLQARGSRAIAQRDIDEAFHSVFIAGTATGLKPVDELKGLAQLKGRRFTFGSESSTSGRLMPEHFLAQAGVTPDDFSGQPGFSGSHDKTIALVESGTFEAGVVNEQVWRSAIAAGTVDATRVVAILRTPPYHDYHWVIGPDALRRYGDGFAERVTSAFVDLDASEPEAREILDLFGAGRFIETDDANYRQIEEVARRIGLIT